MCVSEQEGGAKQVGPEELTEAVIWNAFFLTCWSLQVSRQAAVAMGGEGLERPVKTT